MMHFGSTRRPMGQAACGTSSKYAVLTLQPRRASCQRCRRTSAWKEAMESADSCVSGPGHVLSRCTIKNADVEATQIGDQRALRLFFEDGKSLVIIVNRQTADRIRRNWRT